MSMLPSRNSRESRATPKPLHKRFKMVSKEDIFRYTLAEGMADYANQNLEHYVPKKIKIFKMLKNPVPGYIDPIKKLDEVLKSILRDKHHTNEVNLDNILEKFHGNVRDVMGPLSKF